MRAANPKNGKIFFAFRPKLNAWVLRSIGQADAEFLVSNGSDDWISYRIEILQKLEKADQFVPWIVH